MKTKSVTITLAILTSVLAVFLFPLISNHNQILAQGVPSIPGRIESSGTYFEVKDSEYLNITLKSTEEIKVVLESIPRMISLDISSSTIPSTNLTLKSLEQNKKYYKYEDSYKNGIEILSNGNGEYSWQQDLTKPHHIWIQEARGTKFIRDDENGGDCNSIGNWDLQTKTCILNQDLNESLEIKSDGIILDCQNHKIQGSQSGIGILLTDKKDVKIKNCEISNFSNGIVLMPLLLPEGSNNFLFQNKISNNYFGVVLVSISNETLQNNIITSNEYGINLFDSNNNFISQNHISNNGAGITLIFSSQNLFIQNLISHNERGIVFEETPLDNKVYHNNFIENEIQVSIEFETEEKFILDNGYPSGGNYWSDYTGKDEKSGENQNQPGSDGIGDTPYTFYGSQDRYPFMKENGWEVPVNQPPTFSNPNQYKSDGILPIDESSITTESTVVFKAILNDSDNDQIKLQIELRQTGEPFTGIDDGGILNSDFVDSGSEVTIIREGLVNGEYKWRARAVDSRGGISDWQEFGEIGNVDFEVKLVPLYTQVESQFPPRLPEDEWANLSYGTGNYPNCLKKDPVTGEPIPNTSTIARCGCAITSEVMILRFHSVITTIDGKDVNPLTFNNWLTGNNGYRLNGDVKWEKIQEYSRDGYGFVRVIYDGPIKFKDNFTLDFYLDDLKPVILYEKALVQGVPTSHFIVADGKLANTYTVKDPAWYGTKYLTQATGPYIQNYNNNFYGLRLFSPALALRGVDSISLNLASPAELLVIDPQGRKLGKDPINNIEYNEIPNGSYYQEGIGNPFPEAPTPTKESKFIWIPNPLDGEYNIQVIGTDLDTYTLDFLAYNEAGEPTDASFEGITNTEIISSYTINYSSVPGEITEVGRVVTIEDIISDVETSYELGWITKEFVKNILVTKLKVAQRLEQQKEKQLGHFDELIEEVKNPIAKQKIEEAKERYEIKMNEVITRILELFIKEVKFYNKKSYLTDQASELLIDDAQYIIEHL